MKQDMTDLTNRIGDLTDEIKALFTTGHHLCSKPAPEIKPVVNATNQLLGRLWLMIEDADYQVPSLPPSGTLSAMSDFKQALADSEALMADNVRNHITAKARADYDQLLKTLRAVYRQLKNWEAPDPVKPTDWDSLVGVLRGWKRQLHGMHEALTWMNNFTDSDRFTAVLAQHGGRDYAPMVAGTADYVAAALNSYEFLFNDMLMAALTMAPLGEWERLNR